MYGCILNYLRTFTIFVKQLPYFIFLKQLYFHKDTNNNFHPNQLDHERLSKLKFDKVLKYLVLLDNGECGTIVTSDIIVTHAHGPNIRQPSALAERGEIYAFIQDTSSTGDEWVLALILF